jgi:Histidine kinase-, DNA gyrase B-, and HSP90-like ATPase
MHNPVADTAPPDPLQDERRRWQLERMAMVGTLAAGLGHDLRNLLMPVTLRLDVLAASADLSSALREDVVSIQASVARLQRLASGLRLLASDPFEQHNEVQHLHLATWWLDVAPLIVDALAPGTRLTASLGDDLPVLAVPPGVLTQVVMHLVMNARRAMTDAAFPAMSFVGTAAPDDAMVQLTVQDNGRGMTEEVRQRCFEPFFTTRPRDYATGLGLSTARSLLQRYGGDLRLLEPVGTAGAAFALTLPARARSQERVVRQADGDAREPGASSRVRVSLRDPRHRTVTLLILSQRGVTPWNDAADSASLATPGTIICDGDHVASLLAELTSQGLRASTRVIAVGTPPEDKQADGVSWVHPTQLGTLAALLD